MSGDLDEGGGGGGGRRRVAAEFLYSAAVNEPPPAGPRPLVTTPNHPWGAASRRGGERSGDEEEAAAENDDARGGGGTGATKKKGQRQRRRKQKKIKWNSTQVRDPGANLGAWTVDGDERVEAFAAAAATMAGGARDAAVGSARRGSYGGAASCDLEEAGIIVTRDKFCEQADRELTRIRYGHSSDSRCFRLSVAFSALLAFIPSSLVRPLVRPLVRSFPYYLSWSLWSIFSSSYFAPLPFDLQASSTKCLADAAAVSGRSVREYSESDFECILGELRRRGAVGGAAGRGPEPDGASCDRRRRDGRAPQVVEPELDAAYRDSAASEKSQEEALIIQLAVREQHAEHAGSEASNALVTTPTR